MSDANELDLLRKIADAAMVVATETRDTDDWRDEVAIGKADHARLWDALAAWQRFVAPVDSDAAKGA